MQQSTKKYSIYLTKTFSNDQGKLLQMGTIADAEHLRDVFRLDRKGQGFSISVFDGNEWVHSFII